MPYEVPNDVITYDEKRIELNILISACMPYCNFCVTRVIMGLALPLMETATSTNPGEQMN